MEFLQLSIIESYSNCALAFQASMTLHIPHGILLYRCNGNFFVNQNMLSIPTGQPALFIHPVYAQSSYPIPPLLVIHQKHSRSLSLYYIFCSDALRDTIDAQVSCPTNNKSIRSRSPVKGCAFYPFYSIVFN